MLRSVRHGGRVTGVIQMPHSRLKLRKGKGKLGRILLPIILGKKVRYTKSIVKRTHEHVSLQAGRHLLPSDPSAHLLSFL